MKIKTTLATMAATLVLSSGLAWAHHSLFAQFDVRSSVTLKGTITKVEWRNPHGWIHLDVKGPTGKVEKWAVETGSPLRMQRRGLHPEFLRIGAEAIVGGFAARGGVRTMAGWFVALPEMEDEGEGDASFSLGR